MMQARDAHSTDTPSIDVHARNERRVRDTPPRAGGQPMALTSFVPAPAAFPS